METIFLVSSVVISCFALWVYFETDKLLKQVKETLNKATQMRDQSVKLLNAVQKHGKL